MDKLYRNEEWLKDARVNQKRTLEDIGDQFGITKEAIRLWCNKFNIPGKVRGQDTHENGLNNPE